MCIGGKFGETAFRSIAKRRDVHDGGNSGERRRSRGGYEEKSIGRKWPGETKVYLKRKTNILYKKKTVYNDDADDSPLRKSFGGKKNK